MENAGFEQIQAAAAFIRDRVAVGEGSVGVVLGSGLGSFADQLDAPQVVDYAAIPHFPQGSVAGHRSRLVSGRVAGTPVLAMQGRVHMYEGYTPQQVVLPIRVLISLGVKVVVVTNAAGGIGEGFEAGDLMVIEDHINLSGRNPLTGTNDDRLGERFPDMSDAYTAHLRQVVRQIGVEIGVKLQTGVYGCLLGPSYETPSEIRMLKRMGVDAVGMSTVPEVIACNHARVPVVGLSCITNLAAGISPTPLSHDEVKETADRVARDFVRLLQALVPMLAKAC